MTFAQIIWLNETYFTARPREANFSFNHRVNCDSDNVTCIYLATCNKCNLQYVGSTSTNFKVRFRHHQSTILAKKKTCELAVHFNHIQHDFSHIKFIVIERTVNARYQQRLEHLLLTREAY